MEEIIYSIGDETLSNEIENLWVKLNEYENSVTVHFKEDFKLKTFIDRKIELLNKSQKGKVRIAIAKNKSGEVIGFCIFYLMKRKGTIDGIFIEENYRHKGIGKSLVNRVLNWMKKRNIKRINVNVIIEDIGTIEFYEKCGFYPKTVELKYR